MPESARISVRVQPRASKNEVIGFDETGVLRVRVTAPPVGGAANKAVAELLADTLGVPKSTVSIASGQSGRNKLVDVENFSVDQMRKQLG